MADITAAPAAESALSPNPIWVSGKEDPRWAAEGNGGDEVDCASDFDAFADEAPSNSTLVAAVIHLGNPLLEQPTMFQTPNLLALSTCCVALRFREAY